MRQFKAKINHIAQTNLSTILYPITNTVKKSNRIKFYFVKLKFYNNFSNSHSNNFPKIFTNHFKR